MFNVKEHNKVWKWLYNYYVMNLPSGSHDSLFRLKEKYMLTNNIHIINNCFCCHATAQKHGVMDCSICPMPNLRCLEEDSEFMRIGELTRKTYLTSEEQSLVLSMLRNMQVYNLYRDQPKD